MANRTYYWVVDPSLETLATSAGFGSYIKDTSMGRGVLADDWNNFYFDLQDWLLEYGTDEQFEILDLPKTSVYWSQAAGSFFYS